MSIGYEKQLIAREYSGKLKFPNYNEVVKKLQCNHVLSFSNAQLSSDADNYDAPVSTCKFSNKVKDILAVANENGIVQIENTKYVKTLTYIQTHKNTVYDIAWMPGNMQFVTVSGDNSAKLWNCSESNVQLISSFRGHKRSVKCVSFKPENTAVFATGSRDGSLMIWDARAWKKCAKFSHHLPDQIISPGAGSSPSTNKKKVYSVESLNSKSVTGLVFQNDNTLISCGSVDGFIRVWDMRKTYSRSISNPLTKHQLCSPSSGFSYLCMNAIGTKLYANCMDSYIYCFNINSYDPEPVAAYYGHENGSFYVKSSVSFDGAYLMSGSSDENAYIWNTRNAELSEEAIKPFVCLSSHSAEVTCVEMSPDNMLIVSCSDDGTFRLWNPFTSQKNEERGRIDSAILYDTEKVETVKTKWKNKRKFNHLEECDLATSNTSDCSSHTKICRFYITNLSSSCICHTKFTQAKGEKRENEISTEERARKRTSLEMLERTPPKQSETKHLIPVQFMVNSTTPKKRILANTNGSSKRKLEDMPNFIEEGHRTKKINCGRILTPLNKVKKCNTDVGSGQEVQKTPVKSLLRTYQSSPDSNSRLDPSNQSLGLSSPTSNLPNYIEDGTSPYIHRCPKVIQKENDWLTKLRKNFKPIKTPGDQKSAPESLTPPGAERKKKSRQVDHTLHKYFKISSKVSEKTFSSQEPPKQTIVK